MSVGQKSPRRMKAIALVLVGMVIMLGLPLAILLKGKTTVRAQQVGPEARSLHLPPGERLAFYVGKTYNSPARYVTEQQLPGGGRIFRVYMGCELNGEYKRNVNCLTFLYNIIEH